MSWADPAARQTGDLVTAAIWNQDVVANTAYLHAEDDAYPLGRSEASGFFDSGWFAVSNDNVTHTYNHGLGGTPRLVVLLYADSATPSTVYNVVMVGVGTSALYGVRVGADATSVKARTGTSDTSGVIYSWSTTATAGYWRLLAWV